MSPVQETYTAFEGDRCIARGPLGEVASAAKALLQRRPEASILLFADATGAAVDIDTRGCLAEVLARLPAPSDTAEPDVAPTSRGPGRPRLGVVAREVTLLPRHWDWLARQRGGASVALRRLVEEARHRSEPADRVRSAQEAAYRFMSAISGDRPNFEAATRALFAGDRARFAEAIALWPADIRTHTARLAAAAFGSKSKS